LSRHVDVLPRAALGGIRTVAARAAVIAQAVGARPRSGRDDLVTKGVRLPAGSLLRISCRGYLVYGVIERGTLVVDGERFRDLSAAAGWVSGTGRDGWREWYLLLPRAQYWRRASELRDPPPAG